MNKSELLFYDAYEQFYAMTSESIAFKEFCKDAYGAEGNKQWFDMLMLQTECAMEDYKEFEKKLARYIYVAKKTTTT